MRSMRHEHELWPHIRKELVGQDGRSHGSSWQFWPHAERFGSATGHFSFTPFTISLCVPFLSLVFVRLHHHLLIYHMHFQFSIFALLTPSLSGACKLDVRNNCFWSYGFPLMLISCHAMLINVRITRTVPSPI
ncbi:hypothetical protein V8C42DRAFT_306143 [Trichoderma barbatum]